MAVDEHPMKLALRDVVVDEALTAEHERPVDRPRKDVRGIGEC
jgi:hypothetical protein